MKSRRRNSECFSPLIDLSEIKGSKFRTKIEHLLKNQPKINQDFWNYESESVKSNGWGTIVYLLDKEKDLRTLYQKNGGKVDRIEGDASGNFIIKLENNLPQYVGREAFELFLDEYCVQINDFTPDCIVTIDQEIPSHPENLVAKFSTVGIGLRVQRNYENIFFLQRGRGLNFDINPISEFENRLSTTNYWTLK